MLVKPSREATQGLLDELPVVITSLLKDIEVSEELIESLKTTEHEDAEAALNSVYKEQDNVNKLQDLLIFSQTLITGLSLARENKVTFYENITFETKDLVKIHKLSLYADKL